MGTVRRLALAATVAAASVAVIPTPAAAEERVCRGALGRVTVDNLRVPQGATCRLDGTQIRGNIVVERSATLSARTIRVVGNIQAEGASQVDIGVLSSVGGSVQLERGGGATVTQTRINGDLELEDHSRAVAARSNVVGGNLYAERNRGGVQITENRVDGNLDCELNSPAPRGFGNTVRGTMEDQCRRLVK
jgi:hypothetical protein